MGYSDFFHRHSWSPNRVTRCPTLWDFTAFLALVPCPTYWKDVLHFDWLWSNQGTDAFLKSYFYGYEENRGVYLHGAVFDISLSARTWSRAGQPIAVFAAYAMPSEESCESPHSNKLCRFRLNTMVFKNRKTLPSFYTDCIYLAYELENLDSNKIYCLLHTKGLICTRVQRIEMIGIGNVSHIVPSKRTLCPTFGLLESPCPQRMNCNEALTFALMPPAGQRFHLLSILIMSFYFFMLNYILKFG